MGSIVDWLVVELIMGRIVCRPVEELAGELAI